MARYDETFVCTAIPAGVDGTKVRLAVLVSPRLSSDDGTQADLDSWPDAAAWPTVQPTWQVTVSQGGTTVTLPATEVSGPYDAGAWAALFPGSSPVVPYEPIDRSQAPIVSYPVAAVRDAIKALHAEALASSTSEFPTVEALQANPVFQALKRALDGGRVAPDPVPDAELSLAEAFGAVELSHGVRPGSFEPPPTVTGVSPSSGPTYGGTVVTITGTDLHGTTMVTFGSAPATDVQVRSRTQVVCTTPDVTTPGTRPVAVTAIGGTSSPDDSGAFTFVAPPRPTVTSLSPTSVTGNRAGALQIHGTHFVGPVSVRLRLAARPESMGVTADAVTVTSPTELLCDTGVLLLRGPDGQPIPDPPPTLLDVYVVTHGGESEAGPGSKLTIHGESVPK